MTDGIVWRGSDYLRDHLVPIDSLVPHPQNPMREARSYDIVQRLRWFGQVRPVLTWQNAEEFDYSPATVIGGHHVWLAAQNPEFRWTHIAAIPAAFESPEAALDYLALDNVLSHRMGDELNSQLSLLSSETFEQLTDRLKADLTSGAMTGTAKIADLEPHERLLERDPVDRIVALQKKFEEVGWADEPLIVTRWNGKNTILVGHGVYEAAALAGVERAINIHWVDVDPDGPEALKIMSEHYAKTRQALVDKRQLSEMLKQISDELGTLEGTGFDAETLSLLLLMSRPATEIADVNAAAEWVGLPEYESIPLPCKLVVSFRSEELRSEFIERARAIDLEIASMKQTLSTMSA